jgi:hypothetical protein
MKTIIRHCAIFGTFRDNVREFRIGEPRSYAQYPISVTLGWVYPRKRRWQYTTITPTNIAYYIIEVDGHAVFDSRDVVPCDMAEWETIRKNKGRKPGFLMGVRV